jgi:hypothetical protein
MVHFMIAVRLRILIHIVASHLALLNLIAVFSLGRDL